MREASPGRPPARKEAGTVAGEQRRLQQPPQQQQQRQQQQQQQQQQPVQRPGGTPPPAVELQARQLRQRQVRAKSEGREHPQRAREPRDPAAEQQGRARVLQPLVRRAKSQAEARDAEKAPTPDAEAEAEAARRTAAAEARVSWGLQLFRGQEEFWAPFQSPRFAVSSLCCSRALGPSPPPQRAQRKATRAAMERQRREFRERRFAAAAAALPGATSGELLDALSSPAGSGSLEPGGWSVLVPVGRKGSSTGGGSAGRAPQEEGQQAAPTAAARAGGLLTTCSVALAATPAAGIRSWPCPSHSEAGESGTQSEAGASARCGGGTADSSRAGSCRGGMDCAALTLESPASPLAPRLPPAASAPQPERRGSGPPAGTGVGSYSGGGCGAVRAPVMQKGASADGGWELQKDHLTAEDR